MRPPQLSPSSRARRGAVNSKALVIGGVLVLILSVAAVAMRPHPISSPTGYGVYADSDHVFKCAAPEGWRLVEARAHDTDTGAVDSADVPGGVLFGQGSATIDVTTGRTMEVIKNDLLSSSGPVPDSLTGSRAVALHRQDRAKLKMMMKDVTLEPAHSYQGQFGECVGQEWHGRSKFFGWGGPQHGYLISMVNGDHTATVTCQCAESDWPTLKPCFLHVVNSITFTGPTAPELAAPSPGLPTLPSPPSQ